MEYVSSITNKVNGKEYVISTAQDTSRGVWQTAVFEQKLVGPPDMFDAAMLAGALDEEQAQIVHARLKEIVASIPPNEWVSAKWKLVNDVLGAILASPPKSDTELREFAMTGHGAEAIRLAFERDFHFPLNGPALEKQLETWSQEESRALVRLGYRVRLAERQVMRGRPLLALGAIHEIMRSEKSPQEKVTAICEYLDRHNVIGVGDPVKPYLLVPIDEIRTLFAQMVDETITLNQIPSEELEMQTELRHRYLAFGYVFRVAEELVFNTFQECHESIAKDSCIPGGEPTRIPWLCTHFNGRQNTTSVLQEKANIVACLIQGNLDSALQLAVPIANQNPRILLGEQQAIQVRSETAVFLIRPVLDIAYGCLSSEEFDTFSEALVQSLTRAMEFEGIQPSVFVELVSERLLEYERYRKWYPVKEEGSGGTLFWEFGKKVAAILRVGKNALFQEVLANLIMTSLDNWQLHQLLRDVPEQIFPDTSGGRERPPQ